MNTKNCNKGRTVIITLSVTAVILFAVAITALCLAFSKNQYYQTDNIEQNGIVYDSMASHYDETVPDKSGDNSGIKVPGYSDVIIPKDSTSIPITLLNPDGNPCNFKFTLSVLETGQTLCSTEYVKPGDAIKVVKLDDTLEKGSYTLVINIATASLDTGTQMNGAQVKTGLKVV